MTTSTSTNVFHSCVGIQIGDRHYYHTRTERRDVASKAKQTDYHHLVCDLLNSGHNVNAKMDEGITPLHLAVVDGNTAIIRTILEYNPDTNSATKKHHITPLHIAHALDRKDIVDLLVQHGADQRKADKDGWQAFHYTSDSGYQRMTHIMKELLGIRTPVPERMETLSTASFESCLSSDSLSSSGSFHSVFGAISTADIAGAGDAPQFRLTDKCQEKSSVMDIFSMFDRRKDGKISLTELTEVIHFLKIPLTPPEIEAMVKAVDINGNGVVDYEEFSVLMDRFWKQADSLIHCSGDLFDIFDADGNGVIGRGEITRVMQNLGVTITEQDITEMLGEADINGDGQIDKAEFQRLLENLKGMAALSGPVEIDQLDI